MSTDRPTDHVLGALQVAKSSATAAFVDWFSLNQGSPPSPPWTPADAAEFDRLDGLRRSAVDALAAHVARMRRPDAWDVTA